jgi:L-lactate permease
VTPRQLGQVTVTSLQQLAFPVLTIVAVLSFAFLMNYSGATATLGLAFASTGRAFPFFGSLLGWLGVFVVGSEETTYRQLCALVREEVEPLRQNGKELPPPGTRPMKEAVLA